MNGNTGQGQIPEGGKPPEVAPAGEGVIDRSILEEYVEMIGEGGVQSLLRLIEIFLNTSPALFDKLEVALSKGDYQEMRRSAHTVKSSSASLGADHLSELCREMEMQALEAIETRRPAENMDRFARLAVEIRAEFERGSQALGIIYQEYQP